MRANVYNTLEEGNVWRFSSEAEPVNSIGPDATDLKGRIEQRNQIGE